MNGACVFVPLYVVHEEGIRVGVKGERGLER